ncbi:hypothetical protein DL96DRAFT_1625583 [Flagelloscypha sp. PMI_526]|nr:hypothetical protein DL96DRAFT_1625583 [Flagelloscypha sp. PMI_526]
MAGSEPLPSTFDDIIRQCSKVRLLVVGKTGVGKTSLLKKVFGVDSLNVSHNTRGESDVNAEITSPSNQYFVCHDPRGYEPGDDSIYNELEAFILDRLRRKQLGERIHIIWLCLATPFAGGRLLDEVGNEKVIKLCQDHNLPFIVVFTKYDQLIQAIARDLFKQGQRGPDVLVAAKKGAEKRKNEMISEFSKAHPDVYCEFVSDRPHYEDTLNNLVNATKKVQIMHNTPVSQPDQDDLLEEASGSIEITHLLTSTAQQCLDVLHGDVVRPWNFNDPNELLLSAEFKSSVSRCGGAEDKESSGWNRFVKDAGLAAGLAGIAAGVSGPLAVITVPAVFGGVFFAAWTLETYRAIPTSVKHLMVYIVNLISIMQRIPQGSDPLDRESVSQVIASWETSAGEVRKDIDAFVDHQQVWKKDSVVQKIISLVEKYKVK